MNKLLIAVFVPLAFAACSGPAASVDAGTNSCSAPKTTCGSSCVDLKSDNANCGKCGTACSATDTCAKGTCYPKTCAQATCTANHWRRVTPCRLISASTAR